MRLFADLKDYTTEFPESFSRNWAHFIIGTQPWTPLAKSTAKKSHCFASITIVLASIPLFLLKDSGSSVV